MGLGGGAWDLDDLGVGLRGGGVWMIKGWDGVGCGGTHKKLFSSFLSNLFNRTWEN